MGVMLYPAVWIALLIVHLAAGLLTAGHAVVYKRDPRAALAWLIAGLTLPILGPALYLLFGINRIHRRAKGWKRARARAAGSPEHEFPARAQLRDLRALGAGHLKELFELGSRLTQRPAVLGNRVEPLHDGEQAYPAMLAAIRSAERSVTVCSYIFDADETGRQFVDALADAHRRGVQVRALLDGMGERYSRTPISRWLAAAGVPWARFLPVRSAWPGSHINLRNHRKLLVVDGKVAFAGGMNISNRHLVARSENPRRVADLHFRVAGPVVTQVQEAVAADWFFVTDETLSGACYFPDPAPDGPALARCVTDGPDEDLDKLQWMVLGALGCAHRGVSIMTPYLIPNRAMVAALGTAALRGVSVAIILPERSNLPFIQWATTAYLWELLERGVRVFYQPPPFAHTKLLLVDGVWLLLGSGNLDPRSLRLNFESAIEVYDPALVGRLTRFFDETASRSHEVTLAEVDGRPLAIRLRDGVAKLFSPYL